jgi:ribosomal protein L21E
VDVADFRFTAGRVTLEKQDHSTPGQKSDGAGYALRFTGDVSSKGFFSKLFNLNFREQIESLVEPSSFTIQKTKKIDEQGKRARASEAVYDHANGKVVWIEHDPNNSSRPPRTASSSFTGRVQDVLSAIYYLRMQPLELGKTFELTIGDSGRVYQIPVRVVEKKVMKTVLGRVEALRVDAEVYGPNRMVSGTGQFSIWFANDTRRIPVSARIKTEYGTFNVTLRKVIQNSTPREPLAQ